MKKLLLGILLGITLSTKAQQQKMDMTTPELKELLISELKKVPNGITQILNITKLIL